MKRIIFIVLFLLPFLSDACSVCRGGFTKDEKDAYLLTVAILASLPMVMVSGLFFWIYKKYKVKSS